MATPSLARRVARAAMQSGAIMTISDIAAQVLHDDRAVDILTSSTRATEFFRQRWDYRRTSGWTLTGLCMHGPYFFFGFGAVDRIFGPARCLATVAKKTATAQFFVFPPYLCLMFSSLAFVEVAWGEVAIAEAAVVASEARPALQQISQISEKWLVLSEDRIRERVPGAFLAGCLFWPTSNSINFALMPPATRVVFAALSGAIWNTFLSWYNRWMEEQKVTGSRRTNE